MLKIVWGGIFRSDVPVDEARSHWTDIHGPLGLQAAGAVEGGGHEVAADLVGHRDATVPAPAGLLSGTRPASPASRSGRSLSQRS